MSDDDVDDVDERIESIQRRAENFREFLKEGEEVIVSLFDGELCVAESFRSHIERKHAKLYGRLMSIDAQLATGWLPYFLGLVVVVVIIVAMQLSWSEQFLGDELRAIINGWWFYFALPAAVVYLISLVCGQWQKRVYRQHRTELLELIAQAGLDRDTLLVLLQDGSQSGDLDRVTAELKLDHGPFMP